MKKILFGLIFGILILNLVIDVRADVITPGYSPIEINNKISNLNEYPDYVFLVFAKLGSNYTVGMCSTEEINTVREDGVIQTPYYKFCQVDVFAIKKSDLNLEILSAMNDSGVNAFLESDKVIKVIEGIDHYEERLISNPVKTENYEYKVDLNKVLIDPTNSSNTKDYKIYFYIGVPLIALIVIIFIFIKRYKK